MVLKMLLKKKTVLTMMLKMLLLLLLKKITAPLRWKMLLMKTVLPLMVLKMFDDDKTKDKHFCVSAKFF